MMAERETVDRLIAHFLADRIGATFEGRISGVTRAGLFVKLNDTGADGFIPARTIGDDYFQYREHEHAMVGRSTGETHRLGDEVTVRLVEAIPVAGALRFELLSEGRTGTSETARNFRRSPRGTSETRRSLRTSGGDEGMPDAMPFEPDKVIERDTATAMRRGFRGRCPNCGQGRCSARS